MPRMKADKPHSEKVNWTKAAIVERKLALGLTWNDIADRVGMNSEVLRQYVSHKPTSKWPPYVLKKVCGALGIPYGTITITIPED